jgi:hypothetical protein
MSRFTQLQKLTLRYASVPTGEWLHGFQWSVFLRNLCPCPNLQVITLIMKVSPRFTASPTPLAKGQINNSAWSSIDQHLSDKITFPRLGEFVVFVEYVIPEQVEALREFIEEFLPILAGSGRLTVLRRDSLSSPLVTDTHFVCPAIGRPWAWRSWSGTMDHSSAIAALRPRYTNDFGHY